MSYRCPQCSRPVAPLAGKPLPPTCPACGIQAEAHAGDEPFFEHTSPVFKRPQGPFKPQKVEHGEMSLLPNAQAAPEPQDFIAETEEKTLKKPMAKSTGRTDMAPSVRVSIPQDGAGIGPSDTPLWDDEDPTLIKKGRKPQGMAPSSRNLGLTIAGLLIILVALGVYWWRSSSALLPTALTAAPSKIKATEPDAPAVLSEPMESDQEKERETSPGSGLDHRVRDADRFAQQNDWIEALRALEEVNSKVPDRPEVLLRMAGIYKEGFKAIDLAENEYKRLIFKINSPDAHRELAALYELKGDFYKALEEYRIYLGTLPADSPGYAETFKKIEVLNRRK